ncbi:hypothetical protein AB835_02205 [Candidatus Endobugula sertula]|uniref:Uncharacterized protein n=1 Tax=Candidatus Endobugula sertula TaxID=62101 RepID=A0A1D2QSZ4_9GAMM|nr:hypothetical protein AB835_02205 [Candidatus Endobugula sertula]
MNNHRFWLKANMLYLSVLAVSGMVWLFQRHTFGVAVGLATVLISFFIYKKQRWAYFSAAVLCFGLLRIAMDDGYHFFQTYGSYGQLFYLIGLITSIILHEKVARK